MENELQFGAFGKLAQNFNYNAISSSHATLPVKGMERKRAKAAWQLTFVTTTFQSGSIGCSPKKQQPSVQHSVARTEVATLKSDYRLLRSR